MDARKLWLTVLGELETTISPAQFKTWFQHTSILSIDNGRVVIAVKNIFARRWLKEKYQSLIIDSLERTLGLPVVGIEYKVAAPSSAASISATSAQPGVAQPQQLQTPAVQSVSRQQTRTSNTVTAATRSGSPQLNPRYTFENFIVGDSNELAYAAAQTVSRYPGEKYNPLFFYGGVGLGKTHLMHAVGNEITRRDPSKKVRYVTSEQFTREFLDVLQTKKTRAFSDLYRGLDVLIVDDIQFLGNKEKTQEEFFHTFNTLHQENKQIIMSSDKPPKAIPQLEDRLRSRFEMGMTADVQRPDLETRAAIIRRKASAEGNDLPLELVEYLARHYQQNIRELEGALTHLIAYCELRGIQPSISIAQGLIGSHSSTSRRRSLTPKSILEKTAMYFHLSPTDLTGARRDKEIALARQVAMYLIRTELNASFPKIALALGKKDHTTAIHSVKKIEKLVESDNDLRADINQLRERITM